MGLILVVSCISFRFDLVITLVWLLDLRIACYLIGGWLPVSGLGFVDFVLLFCLVACGDLLIDVCLFRCLLDKCL